MRAESELLKRSTHLKSLHMKFFWLFSPGDTTDVDMDEFSSLCKGIQSDTVKSIEILDPSSMLRISCAPMFQCLQHFRGLKELTWSTERPLVYAKSEEAFRCLMDLLQVNIYLELADISWVSDGKEELVKEALRKDREQAAYFLHCGTPRCLLEGRKHRVFSSVVIFMQANFGDSRSTPCDLEANGCCTCMGVEDFYNHVSKKIESQDWQYFGYGLVCEDTNSQSSYVSSFSDPVSQGDDGQ
ncbi:hypothetical protein R1sor_025487 [Riccia sorocarpa]|uniref:Uncharacterized protein n=1 Tax=Riccia sorocarpa TaxID=122646 RepID=A0ABD3GAT8_9MARC